MDFAVGAVEQRQAMMRVPAADQAVDDLLGFPGQRPVAVSEARVVGLKKRLGVIDQNPPEGTLVELALPVEGDQTAGSHPSDLFGFPPQVVNWPWPFLVQSNSWPASNFLVDGFAATSGFSALTSAGEAVAFS